MEILDTGKVKEVSLDHDLGLHDFDPDVPDVELTTPDRGWECRACSHVVYRPPMKPGPEKCRRCKSDWVRPLRVPDGYELVRWMTEDFNRIPKKVTIHSWNPPGAQRMAMELRECGVTVKLVPYEVKT